MKISDRRTKEPEFEWDFLGGPARRKSDWAVSFALGLFAIFVTHWLLDLSASAWQELDAAVFPSIGQWWTDLGRSIGGWLGAGGTQ